MKVFPANHDRKYEIPGAPGRARRPVEIDASMTGFTRLQSLRVYRFESGLVVDGHAEEDEVFVVVTSGSVEIKIGWEDSAADAAGSHTLTVPTGASTAFFVAYLPPRSMYRLIPHSQADVAYARATPVGTRSPAIFRADPAERGEGVTSLLDECLHAERLGLHVSRVHAQDNTIAVDLPGDASSRLEALVHVQSQSMGSIGSLTDYGGPELHLHSWETLAFTPGERALLRVAPGADLLVLTVVAA